MHHYAKESQVNAFKNQTGNVLKRLFVLGCSGLPHQNYSIQVSLAPFASRTMNYAKEACI